MTESEKAFWPAKDLRQRAIRMARLIYACSPQIDGVAITGSVARGESVCHDIDLIVLHNGRGVDGSSYHAASLSESRHYDLWFETRSVEQLLGPVVTEQSLRDIAEAVPFHVISVHAKILRDCAYLEKLNQRCVSIDFFKTVFCEIPLLLLVPDSTTGLLKTFLRGGFLRRLFSRYRYFFAEAIPLRHTCTNCCFPEQSWEVRRITRPKRI